MRILARSLSLPLIVGITQTIDLVDALLDRALGEQGITLLSFARLKPLIPSLLGTSRCERRTTDDHSP